MSNVSADLGTVPNYTDRRIVVNSGDLERERLKALPGSKFSGKIKKWHFPVNWGTCLMLRSTFSDLSIGDSLRDWATVERDVRDDVAQIASDPLGADYTVAEGSFYPHQIVGAEWLMTTHRGLLGDEQGVGKTPTVVKAITEQQIYPAIIVCPKAVIPTWEREFAKWTQDPDVRVQVITGSAVQRRKQIAAEADIFITNYETVKAHSNCVKYGAKRLTEKEAERGELNDIMWTTVVVDEAHRIKDPKTQQTRAVKGLTFGAQAEYRFALSGTPMESNVDDLWSILNFLDEDEWPGRTVFRDRYLDWHLDQWGGVAVNGIEPSTEHEFRQLLDNRMLRRTKAQVLPWLPDKVFIDRYGELPPKLRKVYKDMRDDALAELADGQDLMAFNPMVQAGRMLQLAQAPCERVDGEIDEDGVQHFSLQMVEKSPKLDLLDDTLTDYPGKAILWFGYSDLLEMYAARLDERGVPYVKIVGGMSVEQMAAAEDAIQNGDAQYALVILKITEGFTLTECGTAVYVNRPWSSLAYSQSQDRNHRPGAEAHDQVNYVHLTMRGTVEERIIDVLEQKGEDVETVLRDRDRLEALL